MSFEFRAPLLLPQIGDSELFFKFLRLFNAPDFDLCSSRIRTSKMGKAKLQEPLTGKAGMSNLGRKERVTIPRGLVVSTICFT